jgi:hypothetical protein
MNVPWWVYRIWAKENGRRPLNTYRRKKQRPGEGEKLESLICETIDQIVEGTRNQAERIVAYAWALYVFADPPLYDESTTFPLSSFIEVSRGYIVAAWDGMQDVERSRGQAEKAFRDAME